MGIVLRWLLHPGALAAVRAARQQLETVHPVKGDCGRLCGHACCLPDETGENGMQLFPYEERLYHETIEGFPFRLVPDSTVLKTGTRLVCEGRCDRPNRPLACRLFPLRLRVNFDAAGDHPTVAAEIDPRAWAVCPLPEQARMNAFDPAFVKAVEATGNILVRNLCQLEFLVTEQALLDEMKKL